MNNEEQILALLKTLVVNVETLTANVETLTANAETTNTNLEVLATKVGNLEATVIANDKKVERYLNFLLEEIERSDKRILGYLEDRALNEAGEQAKASLGLL